MDKKVTMGEFYIRVLQKIVPEEVTGECRKRVTDEQDGSWLRVKREGYVRVCHEIATVEWWESV